MLPGTATISGVHFERFFVFKNVFQKERRKNRPGSGGDESGGDS
jgi:hypothetical protein